MKTILSFSVAVLLSSSLSERTVMVDGTVCRMNRSIDRLIVHAGAHPVGVALASLASETLVGAGVYLTSLRLIAPDTTADLAALARPLLAHLQLKLPRAPFMSEHGR